LSAAEIIGGVTASFVSEELAENLAALGKVATTRRQVRSGGGRCSKINPQLRLEVKFGYEGLTMSLLILLGVVDSLVLGWTFLTQVGTEIKCAGGDTIGGSRSTHKRR